jgi:predicted SPOUT superfamily RNA methylase MTH1
LLPSLDIPHHFKAEEWCQYREAVSVGPADANGFGEGAPYKKQKRSSIRPETIVDAGFPVTVAGEVPPHTRLTIKFSSHEEPRGWPASYNNTSSWDAAPQISADAVDPAAPREEAGYYWGYTVRRAATLSAVFTESPFEDGYDVSIGTSERGEPLQDSLSSTSSNPLPETSSHTLLVIGGVAGLEVAVEADKELAEKGIGRDNVGDLFDFYVNVCPGQGSRTIRSEEALWIALGQLRNWVMEAL